MARWLNGIKIAVFISFVQRYHAGLLQSSNGNEEMMIMIPEPVPTRRRIRILGVAARSGARRRRNCKRQLKSMHRCQVCGGFLFLCLWNLYGGAGQSFFSAEVSRRYLDARERPTQYCVRGTSPGPVATPKQLAVSPIRP